MLNKDLPIPLYYQLRTILLNGIESGEWQPDQQLPTETDLAQRFGVSKITVRQALRELVELGYVRREQGRGTFVARPELQQGPRELTSFTEEMQRHGWPPSSRVLALDVTAPTPEVAAALQLNPQDRVAMLRRLRLADGEPMGIQTAYIPLELAPGLPQENFQNQSLYAILGTRYGLYAASARETHFAVALEPAEAELLEVAPGAPALSAERITFLPGGRPLEFVRSLMRGDRYRIVLDLSRETPRRRRE